VSLIERWVGTCDGRWLKTDLFEELSEHRALLPALTGTDWVGVDISPAVVRQAGLRSSVRAVAADVRSLPFASGSFDGVLSTSTLDHFDDVEDIHRSFLELRRVLRRDGRLVLTLDNPTNPLIRIRNGLPSNAQRRSGLVPFPVGRTIGRRQGCATLEAAGFRVLGTAFVLHAPHVIGTRLAAWGPWEHRVLPIFDRLGRSRVAPVTGHFVAFDAVAD
jgi:SAM-dependent methyltransferase